MVFRPLQTQPEQKKKEQIPEPTRSTEQDEQVDTFRLSLCLATAAITDNRTQLPMSHPLLCAQS